MKKHMKKIGLASFVFLALFSLTVVLADSKDFYLEIPRAQGWNNTEDEGSGDSWETGNGNGYISSESSNHANVLVYDLNGISQVTFYAGAWKNNGSSDVNWASSGTVYTKGQDDDEIIVNYEYSYGKGQKMGLRVRNHTWSLSKGAVSGNVDYH